MRFLFFIGLLGFISCENTTPPNEQSLARPTNLTTNLDTPALTDMYDKAVAFQNSLSAEQVDSLSFPFTHPDREDWHFIPRHPRFGLRMGFLNLEQQKLAFDFIQTGLSAAGYHTIRDIMALESVLLIKENLTLEADYRNPTKYFLNFFGTPHPDSLWTWTYEGHHLSLHFTAMDGQLVVSPSFLGSNPAEVDIEHPDKGKRVLAKREDLGRKLVKSLTEKQLAKAWLSEEAYPEVITFASSVAHMDKYEGLPYKEMNADQQQTVVDIIQHYLALYKPQIASLEWQRIEQAGLDDIYFAWTGGLDRGQKHYYRLHGPITIIEYDNAQNDGNHAHSVYRDPEHDFGRDWLKEHYAKHQH